MKVLQDLYHQQYQEVQLMYVGMRWQMHVYIVQPTDLHLDTCIYPESYDYVDDYVGTCMSMCADLLQSPLSISNHLKTSSVMGDAAHIIGCSRFGSIFFPQAVVKVKSQRPQGNHIPLVLVSRSPKAQTACPKYHSRLPERARAQTRSAKPL